MSISYASWGFYACLRISAFGKLSFLQPGWLFDFNTLREQRKKKNKNKKNELKQSTPVNKKNNMGFKNRPRQ